MDRLEKAKRLVVKAESARTFFCDLGWRSPNDGVVCSR